MPGAVGELSHDDGPRPVPAVQGQGQRAGAVVDHEARVSAQQLQGDEVLRLLQVVDLADGAVVQEQTVLLRWGGGGERAVIN